MRTKIWRPFSDYFGETNNVYIDITSFKTRSNIIIQNAADFSSLLLIRICYHF